MPCVYTGGTVTLSPTATSNSTPTTATSAAGATSAASVTSATSAAGATSTAASVVTPIILSGLDSTTDPTNEYNIKIYAYTRTQSLHYTPLTSGCVFRLEYGIYSIYDKYTHLFTSSRVGTSNDSIVELSSILQHISKYNMNTFTPPLPTPTTHTTPMSQSIFNLMHSYGILFPTPYFDTSPSPGLQQVQYICVYTVCTCVYIYVYIIPYSSLYNSMLILSYFSFFQQPSINTLENKLIADLIAANNLLPPEQRCCIRSISITIKIKNTSPVLTTNTTANKHAKLTTASATSGVTAADIFQHGSRPTFRLVPPYHSDNDDDSYDSENYDSEGERIYPYRDIHLPRVSEFNSHHSSSHYQPYSNSSNNNSLTLTDSDQLFINSGSIISFTLHPAKGGWEDIHETIIPSKYIPSHSSTAPYSRGYDEYGSRIHKNPLIQTSSLYGYNFEAVNESIQKMINQVQVTSGTITSSGEGEEGEEGKVGNKRKRGLGQDKTTTPNNNTTSNSTSAMQDDDDDDDEVVFVGFSSPVLPHTREHCPEYIFNRSDIVCSNNIRKCDKCYCYICDISASECKAWRSHCNASAKGQLGHVWKQLKEAHTTSNTTSNTTSSSGKTSSSLLHKSTPYYVINPLLTPPLTLPLSLPI